MTSTKVKVIIFVATWLIWYIISETLLAPITDAVYYSLIGMTNLTHDYAIRDCERSNADVDDCLARADMWRLYISVLTSLTFSSVLTVISFFVGLNRVLSSDRGQEQELF